MTSATSNKVSKRNRRLQALARRVEARKALAGALARTALLRGPSAILARSAGGFDADAGIGAHAPGACPDVDMRGNADRVCTHAVRCTDCVDATQCQWCASIQRVECSNTFLTCRDWTCKTHAFAHAVKRWIGV